MEFVIFYSTEPVKGRAYMDAQWIFEPVWKKRYIQMMISCGVGQTDALLLKRGLCLIEDMAKVDICELTQEQATAANAMLRDAYPDQHTKIFHYVSDYIGWRRLFAPYVDQTLQRAEISNSKEMKAIQDIPLSPEDLEHIIVTAFWANTINVAIPCLCLAWMGYEVPDMVQLKTSEVDFDTHMVRGVHIPLPLWRVLKQYHETEFDEVPNKGGMREIYKIPGEWFIKSTDSRKTTTECQVDPRKAAVAISGAARKYRQMTGRDRKITLHLTQEAGLLYRLYEPWGNLTDEKFVEALRFKGRTYVSYQMQSWRKKFTAYCLLREKEETT